MVGEWDRLLEILERSSFRAEKEPIFRLASGRMSKFYVDCKQALSDPEARALVGSLIFEIIGNHTFDAVGGLELGAYPIATSVSDAIHREMKRKVRAFVVRKQPKTHGVRNLLAGDARPGDHALIVDDVITTGGSTIDAITRAREAGLLVTMVIALVDREEDNGKQNIEAHGVSCASLFTLADLVKASNFDAATNAGS
jgi:orotate phosphoribosyltransferase